MENAWARMGVGVKLACRGRRGKQHRTWYHNSVCSAAVPGSECSAACVLCIYESTATRKLQSLSTSPISVHVCCMGDEETREHPVADCWGRGAGRCTTSKHLLQPTQLFAMAAQRLCVDT